jgi:hypothetical protein
MKHVSLSRRLARFGLLMLACSAVSATLACAESPKPAVGFTGPAAPNAKPAERMDGEEVPAVVVYPVADLLAEPARAAASGQQQVQPGMGAGMMGAPASSSNAPESRGDRLTMLIQSVIAPDSWMENGGLVGSLKLMDDQLVIRQTPLNQALIEKLIAELRGGNVAIQINVRWIEMQPGQMESLTEQRDAVRLVKTGDAATGVLNSSTTLGRLELTAYSGDLLTARSGAEQAYVRDLQPVVGSGAVGYAPTIDTVRTGAAVAGAVYVLPGHAARLDLKASHVTLESMGNSKVGEGFVQTPQTIDRSLDVRTTIPLGRAVVVGAVSARAGTTQPSDGTMCYLVVMVTAKTD